VTFLNLFEEVKGLIDYSRGFNRKMCENN